MCLCVCAGVWVSVGGCLQQHNRSTQQELNIDNKIPYIPQLWRLGNRSTISQEGERQRGSQTIMQAIMQRLRLPNNVATRQSPGRSQFDQENFLFITLSTKSKVPYFIKYGEEYKDGLTVLCMVYVYVFSFCIGIFIFSVEQLFTTIHTYRLALILKKNGTLLWENSTTKQLDAF